MPEAAPLRGSRRADAAAEGSGDVARPLTRRELRERQRLAVTVETQPAVEHKFDEALAVARDIPRSAVGETLGVPQSGDTTPSGVPQSSDTTAHGALQSSESAASDIPHAGERAASEAPRVGESAAHGVPQAGPREREARDEFSAAAEALRFTGRQDSARGKAHENREPRQQARRREMASHRVLNTPFRRFATATASAAAVGAVALMAIGSTLPLTATAFGPGAQADAAVTTEAGSADGSSGSEDVESQLQGYVAGGDIESEPLERIEGYEASSFGEIASADGISTSGAFFTNDPTADIQWPFAVGTSMSSPFGWRWGRMHEGVDFTPGSGAPIQAVADGVVRTATEAGGAYGVNVYIDHVIDGELVTTHYAHMQYGSLRVVSGQRVEVGDIIGLTGNTGRSYGAHLHFEVRYNGTAIDPVPWLEEHANRHYSDDERTAVADLEGQLLGTSDTSG
ncbi:M23 family metallopeptidase [Microbacterium suaedae]|uniref:M23 family metallopeptidase n=1 Tax=Microbacterium suaedae TaxID=2067813 RepID=UPI001E462362|nr:M23 family metallopeptidase [Microbacterium suaedae]